MKGFEEHGKNVAPIPSELRIVLIPLVLVGAMTMFIHARRPPKRSKFHGRRAAAPEWLVLARHLPLVQKRPPDSSRPGRPKLSTRLSFAGQT